MMRCKLCPRKCDAIRTAAENIGGFCKSPMLPVISRADLHFWEEPPISGKNGSGTVFFSGCNLGCMYCQNAEISREIKGRRLEIGELAEVFKALEKRGAHNINLVTPTHYAEAIMAALDIYKPQIPIVWNSGGYESEETLRRLRGYVDIFLIDFKYMSGSRADEFSAAFDYPIVAKRAIRECMLQQPECVFDENGMMKRGVIIRHLLLPQATREAIEIFDWVRENAGGAYFSIMSQYVPMGQALNHPIIGRKVTMREYKKICDYIAESGFENCFIQSRKSADEGYIPPFDLK